MARKVGTSEQDSVASNVPKFSPRRLTAAREARGLSRSQVHIEMARVGQGRCRALIDLWSTGASDPRASDLAALAFVLDVPIDYFFERAP